MTLHFIPSAVASTAAQVDLEPVWTAIDDVDAKAANARQMVLNRDPRLEAVEFTAAQADAAHAQLLALIEEIQLTPGPQGPAGEQGPAGPAGSAGAQGPKGDAGTAGPTGPQGIPGTPGTAGAKGDKGDTGTTGQTGGQGPQGIKGDTGLTGNTGAQGVAGPAGTANLAVAARPVASLANNATAVVVCPLSRTMPNNTYEVQFAHTIATTGSPKALYSNIQKTTTSVTVTVTASGALAAGTLIAVAW